ncbi:hypothetical protein AURDEDRAFT_123366 [Auricularia subglabra TFB-10046 SS5]|nr:hypothetical protein AURDEDRAFT_123366 [Auricularia subglabra TFB-10046 SS5]
MLRIVFTALAALAAMVGSVNAVVPRQTVDCATATAQTIPLIRAFNGLDHYYNTNSSEIARAVASGWNQTAVAGHVLPTQLSGTIPLFRLVNGAQSAHLLTASTAERNGLISNPASGWTDEGISGFILSSPLCGTLPFFRVFEGDDHFSTISTAEKATALENGYVDQGNTGFIWPV